MGRKSVFGERHVGWKASCVLINEREPGFLGTLPAHDSARARRLIADLGLGPCRSQRMTTFDEGINPDCLVVGAYDGAAIIGDPQITGTGLSTAIDLLTSRILSVFPRAEVLRVELASVVNLWSYAYFEKGRLRRAYAGTAESGVVLDEGTLLPEEQPHFDRSVVRDGQRFFSAQVDGKAIELDAVAYAETLTFAVMVRFFGIPLDQVDAEVDLLELSMEAFQRERPRKWWQPFPKR